MLCLLVSLIISSHLKKISIPISIHIYLLLQVSCVMCAMTVATTLQNVAYLSNLISHTSKKKKSFHSNLPLGILDASGKFDGNTATNDTDQLSHGRFRLELELVATAWRVCTAVIGFLGFNFRRAFSDAARPQAC